ncbi:ABC transporter permease [Streptomyces sp. NPDC056716]|uniref:ABC transporter permease n=1 Tax=unclassified Streptomyces TaxID=2593676 RepID=UPI0036B63260
MTTRPKLSARTPAAAFHTAAGRRRPPLVLLLPATAAALLALLPLGYLGVRAMEHGWGHAWDIVAERRTLELLGRSLALTAIVVAASLLLGISLAWLTVRTTLPGRRVWAVLATLPLAVPSYVAAFTWMSAAPSLAGLPGAAITLTFACFPYVFLPVAAALRGIDPAQEETARSLGSGPWETFLRVTLPQLRPAAAGGAILVALYVLSDFGSVSITRYDTFTRAIHSSYQASFDRTPAAVLGCVLVAMTVLLVLAENRTRGRAGHSRTGRGSARPPLALALGRWTAPALAWCAAVAAAAVAFPLGTLGYWLTVGNSGWDPERWWSALVATVTVAAAGAAVTTLLALPVGVLSARHRGRLARLLEQSVYAGHAVPGITVGLALVFFSVRYAYPLYQELPLLIAAYVVLFLPVAVASARAAVLQSPPVLEDVARSLGRSPLQVLREITVPLAAPGIGAGAALTFVVIMKELPATLLLRPTGTDTLATRLWTETGAGAFAGAAPYAASIVLLAAIPSYLLGRRS